MANLAFELVANFKDNISPAINQLKQNAGNLSKQFDESKGKLFQFDGASKKMGSAIESLSGGMIKGSEATKLLGSAFGGLTPQMLAALGVAGVVAAAVVKVAGAFNKAMGDVQKLGDEIDKGSQKIGFSTDAYQEWNYVLNLSGSSIQKVAPGLKNLQKVALESAEGNQKAADTFKTLGVNVSDSQGKLKSSEALFEETVKSLSKMDDQTHRTAIAMRLFGESGTEIAPMLNSGTEAIERQRKEAERYGKVTERTVNASAALGDAQYKLSQLMETLKASLVTPMMERLSEVYNTILNSGIVDFFKSMATVIGELVDIALLPLTKAIEGIAVAFNGLELIARGSILGVVKGVQSLLALTPVGWKEDWKKGINDIAEKLDNDFNDAIKRSEENTKRLFSVKPTIDGKKKGDNEGGSDFDDAMAKQREEYLKRFEAIYQKFNESITKMDRENRVLEVQIWETGFEQKKKLLALEYDEKQAVINKQYNDTIKSLRDEEKERGEHNKEIIKLEKLRITAIASLREQLELKIAQLNENELDRRLSIAEKVEKETANVKLSVQKNSLEKTIKILDAERDERLADLKEQLGNTAEYERAKLAIKRQYAMKETAAAEAWLTEYDKTVSIINDRINTLELDDWKKREGWHKLFFNKDLELLDLKYKQEQDANRDNADALLALEREYYLQRDLLRQEDAMKIIENANAVTQAWVNVWNALIQTDYDIKMKGADNLEKAKAKELKAIDDYAKTDKGRYMDTAKEKAKIEKKYSDDIEKIKADAEKEANNRLKAYKKVAAAAAIIDSLVAAVSAFKAMAGIPYVGPALGAAAAASAIAMGVVNARQISAQQFAEGGFPQGANAIIQVNERGQEAVLNNRAVQYLGRETINALNAGLKLGNEQSVTINAPVTFNANAIDQTSLPSFQQALEEHQVVIARLIEDAYSRNLIDRSRI